MKKYDVVVIGSGPGGYVSAIRTAQAGLKTAVIEKDQLGGLCLNAGCIPTKTLLTSAKHYHDILQADTFGITLDKESVHIDTKKILKRKKRIVTKLRGGVKLLLSKNGVDVIQGEATVQSPTRVQVGTEEYEADKIILAFGTRHFIPPIDGIQEAMDRGFAIDSTQMLSLEELPERFVIIGGGVIAIEFATYLALLGKQVTLLKRSPVFLPKQDQETVEVVLKELRKMGVSLNTGCKMNAIKGNKIYYEQDGLEHELESDKILICAGTYLDDHCVEALSLEKENKFIKTNEYMQTSIENVYAIGDIVGHYELAHVASYEGIIAAHHIAGDDKEMSYDVVPSCVYSHPEIASVGLSEEAAKEKGYDVKTFSFPISANGRAQAAGESVGFIKLVADQKTEKLLGMHAACELATELIATGVMVLSMNGSYRDVTSAIFPHPTVSEMTLEAAIGLEGKPLNII